MKSTNNNTCEAEQSYYMQEANGGFVGWTLEGMEFLYKYKSKLLTPAHKTLLRRMLCLKHKNHH